MQKIKSHSLCFEYYHISETPCALLGGWAGTQETYLNEMCLLSRDGNSPTAPKD